MSARASNSSLKYAELQHQMIPLAQVRECFGRMKRIDKLRADLAYCLLPNGKAKPGYAEDRNEFAKDLADAESELAHFVACSNDGQAVKVGHLVSARVYDAEQPLRHHDYLPTIELDHIGVRLRTPSGGKALLVGARLRVRENFADRPGHFQVSTDFTRMILRPRSGTVMDIEVGD